MPLFGLNPWPALHAAQLRGTWTRRGQPASPWKSPTGPRPRPTRTEAWGRSQRREPVGPAWAWAVGKVSPQSGLWRPAPKRLNHRFLLSRGAEAAHHEARLALGTGVDLWSSLSLFQTYLVLPWSHQAQSCFSRLFLKRTKFSGTPGPLHMLRCLTACLLRPCAAHAAFC